MRWREPNGTFYFGELIEILPDELTALVLFDGYTKLTLVTLTSLSPV